MTITFDPNSGTLAPKSVTAKAGSITLPSQKPSRNGYSFSGWSKSKTASTAEYAPSATINTDVSLTLYAVWERNPTPTINISNVQAPEQGKNYKVGIEFDFKGIISSTDILSSVTVGIYRQDNGKSEQEYSFNPNAKQVDLFQTVDRYINFGNIPAGSYTYRVTAKDVSGFETTLIDNDFTIGDVTLTNDEQHAIEALTSFFYGSQYWKWDTSHPLYDDVLRGLQALFFFEEDFVGTNSYKELDADGYLVCEMISEEKLHTFLSKISGFGLPSDSGSNLDFDQIGYYISDGYYQFYPTDYNRVPYIVAVKSLGSDVFVVRAIMRSSLDSVTAPTQEELNSQPQYDMYLRRNSKSPYGFTLEWRPQGEVEIDFENGLPDGATTEILETQGDAQEQHDSAQGAITWHDTFLENGTRKALGKNADQEISPEELASINTLTILGDTIVINDRTFWNGYGDVKDVGKIDGHDNSYFGCDPYHPQQTTGTVSLQDLKYFPNLESLNLLSISIQDLKGINNCKNLNNLRVHGCNGFSFAVLSRAVPLQEVYIWCQQDVNVKDLLGFDNLELLDIYCSPLNGTEYLAELSSLKHLGLYWSSNLSNVEFLYQLPNLTFLSLGEDAVEDISPISTLTHLKSLYLSRGVLEDQDMKNISRLTGLVHFGADALGWDDGLQSPLEDLSFLRNLTDLEDISLDFNDVEIGALTPLENLDNLRSLSLEGAFFTSDSDYRTLSKLTGLRDLNLKGNSIVDIDIISKFTNLEILNLSNTYLKDVHFLSNFTKIERLDLSENSIEDIQSLSKLVHLKSLSLSGNLKFSNLSPLQSCEELEELDIGWTAVTDVSALQGLPLKKICIKDKTLESELRTMFPNAEIIIE